MDMHTYYDLKDMLHEELRELTKTGELSAGSLETVDKILNSIKNICKITMYEEYSEDDYSRDGEGGGDYSNARRRDSMGRYTRDGEGGYSTRRRYSRRPVGGRGLYSYDDDKQDKVEMLREMMNEAGSEEERKMIQKLINRMS